MTRARDGLLLVALLGAAVVASRCESVPLTAPAGSSIFLQANPTSVPANGGRSLVTALVVEPAGTLVPDGTEVLFLTDLGTIDQTAETVNGIARVYFVSDARSGSATVTAMSGGPSTVPSAEPTTTTTTPTAASSEGGRFGVSGRWAGDRSLAASTRSAARATASVSTQATVTIEVGATLPTRVVVGASPQRITTGSRRATIVANVYDSNGNPVQNVPVIFKIVSVTTTTTTTTAPTTTATTSTAGLFDERLESGSAPRYTDSTGQAFDVLHTTDPVLGVQKTVKISATTSNGVSGEVEVAID